MISRSTLLAAVGAIALVACGGAAVPPERARSPEWTPRDQEKGHVAKSPLRPLIVEWPSPDRAALEAQSKAGVVAVRFLGREMEVLRQCHGGGAYRYVAVTPKRDVVSLTSRDELYATLPVHAIELEAKLKSSGRLTADMFVVGSWDAPEGSATRARLSGDCARATHVITGITAGAFAFTSGGSSAVSGGIGLLGASAGAGRESAEEVLSKDGERDACTRATGADASPPEGCSAYLRVELAPVDRGSPEAAPGGVALVGTPRATVVVTEPGPPPRVGTALGNTSIVLGSVGLVTGLSTGMTAWIMGASLKSSCPDRTCPNEKEGSVRSYRTVAKISTYGFVAGALLIGGGIAINATASDPAPKTAVRVGPSGLTLDGRF
ncbi:MAG: hypothetical protein IT374_17110 [Polyangiaceae bacterium]|nr:hypothetical protein [Polyangiaceae bacterium]